MTTTQHLMDAASFRTLSWTKAHCTGMDLTRQEAREALLHAAWLSASGRPLTDAEWLTVSTRLVHSTYTKRRDELEVRFRDLVAALEAADDFRVEVMVQSLLTVTR